MNEHICDGKELTLRYSGLSSATEVRQSLTQYHGNPRIDEVTDVIADFLGSDAESINPKMLDEVCAFVAEALVTNPRLRVAVITNNPKIVQATEEGAASGTTHFPIQAFASADVARKWFARTPLRSKHASMLEY